MNPTHIHLVLNHFPIVGGIIGFMLLAWGTISKNTTLQKTAAAVLTVMALLAIPVFLTGDSAEHAIEKLPSISKALVESHEEAAEISFWLMMVTGAVALFALIMKARDNKFSRSLFLATLFVSLFSTAAMAYAGYTGGQIRHTEISQNAVDVNAGQSGEDGKAEHDDD